MLSSATAFDLDQCKILSFGKELNEIHVCLKFSSHYVRKQPMGWKEYCAERWYKKIQAGWIGALAVVI